MTASGGPVHGSYMPLPGQHSPYHLRGPYSPSSPISKSTILSAVNPLTAFRKRQPSILPVYIRQSHHHHHHRRDVETVPEEIPQQHRPVNLTQLATKPKWVNPCGIDSAMASGASTRSSSGHHHNTYYDVTPKPTAKLFQDIILAAKNALKHSKHFKDEYVSI